MSITILEPGLYTLIVDGGRPNHRHVGVPLGGAADRFSLALGNGLVGNRPEAAALEITLAGPRLRAECMLACVLIGAPFTLSSDRQSLTMGTTFTLQAGEELSIHGTPSGMRAYLCIRGSIGAPAVLGSVTSFVPLVAGSRVVCGPGNIGAHFIRADHKWAREVDVLHVLAGPQADSFDLSDFLAQEFRVSQASNRMGLRLDGTIRGGPSEELVSEPVCPGTVQVTSSRQCIVLGVDGQTVGGYAKIAQVITADLDKLGQLRPGDVVRFRLVDLERAKTVYREKQRELKEWLDRLQAIAIA
jgi:biotin-dependent carboxylase-like uncharacterized protein